MKRLTLPDSWRPTRTEAGKTKKLFISFISFLWVMLFLASLQIPQCIRIGYFDEELNIIHKRKYVHCAIAHLQCPWYGIKAFFFINFDIRLDSHETKSNSFKMDFKMRTTAYKPWICVSPTKSSFKFPFFPLFIPVSFRITHSNWFHSFLFRFLFFFLLSFFFFNLTERFLHFRTDKRINDIKWKIRKRTLIRPERSSILGIEVSYSVELEWHTVHTVNPIHLYNIKHVNIILFFHNFLATLFPHYIEILL